MTGQRFSINKDAGTRHDLSRELMDTLPDRDCVLTVHPLAEFFHAETRKDKLPRADVVGMVRDWMELFPVAAADGCTLDQTIGLQDEHDFAFRDTMLVQAARTAGVTRLLTEDMLNGRMVGQMRLREPLQGGLRPRAGLIRVPRPQPQQPHNAPFGIPTSPLSSAHSSKDDTRASPTTGR